MVRVGSDRSLDGNDSDIRGGGRGDNNGGGYNGRRRRGRLQGGRSARGASNSAGLAVRSTDDYVLAGTLGFGSDVGGEFGTLGKVAVMGSRSGGVVSGDGLSVSAIFGAGYIG